MMDVVDLITQKVLANPKKLSAAFVAYLVLKRFGPSWSLFVSSETSFFDKVARLLLFSSSARKEYNATLNKQIAQDRLSVQKQWKTFGKARTSIPEEGLSVDFLKDIVDQLHGVTHNQCSDTYMSGSIYSYSYWADPHRRASGCDDGLGDGANVDKVTLDSDKDFELLTFKLKDLYTYSFERSYLWNSLHQTEFGAGYWLSYQVIRMVASMYGGNPQEVMGFVTSGGTESLMTAVRCYRDWGVVNRHHEVGQGVILCSETVHAGVDKGCIAYNVRYELIPVNENGDYDLVALEKRVRYHGNDLVAIVGSTPSYSLGLMDPIKELASIALSAGVGFHVDSCLGGFIVNFLDHIDSDFLAIPGVTSLSCDTHKNGWAPKGSSVLVTKDIPDSVHTNINLSYYSYYSIPGWDGGVYGTPNGPGSQHVTHILHAYLALLAIGRNGYRQIANKIHSTIQELAVILKNDGRLSVLGDHPANVIGWKIDPSLNFGKGAIYAFAHEMDKNGVTISAIKGDRVHFCVTGRSAGCPEFIKKFESTLKMAMDKTEEYARDVKDGKCQFPGDAGLYGTLEAAMEPTADNNKSTAEFLQNKIFGQRGATEAVKAHFYALSDPFVNTTI